MLSNFGAFGTSFLHKMNIFNLIRNYLVIIVVALFNDILTLFIELIRD